MYLERSRRRLRSFSMLAISPKLLPQMLAQGSHQPRGQIFQMKDEWQLQA